MNGEDEDTRPTVAHLLPSHTHLEKGSYLLARIMSMGLFIAYACYFQVTALALEKLQPCINGYMAQYQWIACDLR